MEENHKRLIDQVSLKLRIHFFDFAKDFDQMMLGDLINLVISSFMSAMFNTLLFISKEDEHAHLITNELISNIEKALIPILIGDTVRETH